MASLETISFVAAVISIGLSAVLGLWQFIPRKKSSATVSSVRHGVRGNLILITSLSGLGFLTLSMVARTVITGHGPFSNMYEFSMVFSWGIVAMGLFFWRRYRTFVASAIGFVIALGLLLFAYTLPSRSVPLVPALQQSILLSLHVAAAIVAYGAFTVGFAAAIVYLLQARRPASWLPRADILDDMSYHAVIVGLPFMTLVIILGAVWADLAWGRYWGWDPKETASLVTWLLYANYLHVRMLRGWRGTRAAILLIVGFCAVLLTFFGNYFFGGLHSYL